MNRARRTVIAAAVTLLAATTAALAQGRPWPASEAVQIRVGYFAPSGGGDLWDTDEDAFTLDVSDFDDLALGLSWVHSFTNQVELGVNLDFYEETVSSQYRGFVDEDGFPEYRDRAKGGFPIFHDTTLTLTPWTVDVRFLPTGRQRTPPRGRYVLKPTFYVGAGIGTVFWRYEETGDFVFFDSAGVPLDLFSNRFKDDGVAFEIHALAGIELPLSPTTGLLFEGRYSLANDELSGDFSDLGTIELGGTAFYGGLSFRF